MQNSPNHAGVVCVWFGPAQACHLIDALGARFACGCVFSTKCRTAKNQGRPLEVLCKVARMALPSAYLTSTTRVPDILKAIQGAQAPPRFTQKFLESLGFTAASDRLMINVLKALGFLSESGEPIARYHQYLDASQAKSVLADGLRQAYADLFQINVNAQDMTRADVKNKLKTLSQGQYSDAVLDKMASTFKSLVEQADFSKPSSTEPDASTQQESDPDASNQERPPGDGIPRLNGLVYNINLHLPESRDPAVYDALFRSLREHIL